MGGSSPNSDFLFFENLVFFVLFLPLYKFPKKNFKKEDRRGGGGGWRLDNPSFSRIFRIVLT